MKRQDGDGIDPAALVLAALAGGLTVFTQAGPFSSTDLIVGVSMLLVILSYDSALARTKFQSAAFGSVCAFSLLLVLGPLCEYLERRAAGESVESNVSLVPPWLDLVIWGTGTLAFLVIDQVFVLPWRVKRRCIAG